MKRYTETKLEKIMRIGFARIDQIIEKACEDLDEVKPAKHCHLDRVCEYAGLRANSLERQQQLMNTSLLGRLAQNEALFGYRSRNQQSALRASRTGINSGLLGGVL